MNPTSRLFFALPIPDDIRQQMIRWRAEHFLPEAGRPVAAASLHLTLAFLGEISERKCQALRDLASRIRQPAFTVTINDTGQWPRSGIVWLGCRQAPRGLLQLAELLRSQAAHSGCHQSRQPFHPHITLLRGATRPVALPAETFSWTIPMTHFSLYESLYENGHTRYQSLSSWSLTS
ncbi:RNA 2',3'-cyclic phosphodiesterase [Prodigiosinella aquatilis]|nr:RNA 2',3'-cyclic phosphodiesterase [Prodigiosinella sp. LS101]WJV52881.1 RNA 2',3'-cyclic phosphodiesterase [Prodigiosinella sp. LS101]WJV57235.1 RNA 2',3'-cyclic phosphodiesterase [Pectobacteriaceae bacterium C111]